MQAAELAERLQDVRKTGSGYSAQCPAHPDKNVSLSITDGRTGALIKCHAGCEAPAVCSALGLKVSDLFNSTGSGHKNASPKRDAATANPDQRVFIEISPDEIKAFPNEGACVSYEYDMDLGRGHYPRLPMSDPRVIKLLVAPPAKPAIKPTAKQSTDGLTLEQYAQEKGLPVEFLKSRGCSTITYMGAPAVRIPYRDKSGEEKATRYRVSLSGDKFRWKKGTKPILYGLDVLDDERDVILNEGESDTQTCQASGFNALELPGASNWKEDRDADLLAKAPTIFVIDEQDKGGAASTLRSLHSRARACRLHGG